MESGGAGDGHAIEHSEEVLEGCLRTVTGSGAQPDQLRDGVLFVSTHPDPYEFR
jgi:hypothetical protein